MDPNTSGSIDPVNITLALPVGDAAKRSSLVKPIRLAAKFLYHERTQRGIAATKEIKTHAKAQRKDKTKTTGIHHGDTENTKV